MDKLGFIGLGTLGAPFCRRLMQAGYDVTVNDIRKEVQDEFVKAGAKGVATPRRMAETCDIIVSMVRNDDETRAIMEGKDGVEAGIRRGSLVILMSTLSPELCREKAALLAKKGVGLVDAPVSGGGVKAAIAGEMTVMIGAEQRDYERGAQVLKHLGSNLFHMGQVGNGQAAKILNNLVCDAAFFGTVESLTLAKAMGMDVGRMIEIMKLSSGVNWNVQNWDFVMSRRRVTAPEEVRQICYKDMGLGLKLGKEYHVDLPVTKCCVNTEFADRMEALAGDKPKPSR